MSCGADIPRARKRRMPQPPAMCEHVKNQLATYPLDAQLILEGLRFSRIECNCDEADGIARVCLACGAKLCAVHTLDAHVESNPDHAIMLDVISMLCECAICRLSNVVVEGIAEVLSESQDAGPFVVHGTGLRGLHNAGNTCFMNSVWQALSNTSDFRESIFQFATTIEEAEREVLKHVDGGKVPLALKAPKLTIQAQPPPAASMFRSWAHLLTRLWDSGAGVSKTGHGPIDPNDLFNLVKTSIPLFGDSRQHDAHEFLRFFSDSLQAEQSWATDVFGGSLLSEVSCLRCNMVTRKIDPCLDISLDFPVDTILSVLTQDGKPVSARPLRLHDCLRRFAQVEHINRGNDEACKVCLPAGNGNGSSSSSSTPEVVATKRLRLLALPKVLVVHFKRFKWSFYESSTKIARYVQFPLKGLTLKDFRAKDAQGNEFSLDEDDGTVYDLCSVVVHHGRSMGVSVFIDLN